MLKQNKAPKLWNLTQELATEDSGFLLVSSSSSLLLNGMVK